MIEKLKYNALAVSKRSRKKKKKKRKRKEVKGGKPGIFFGDDGELVCHEDEVRNKQPKRDEQPGAIYGALED